MLVITYDKAKNGYVFEREDEDGDRWSLGYADWRENEDMFTGGSDMRRR